MEVVVCIELVVVGLVAACIVEVVVGIAVFGELFGLEELASGRH